MTDKLKIVGNDGKTKYIIDDDNNITDLTEKCICEHPKVHVVHDGDEQLRFCRACGKQIPTSEEKKRWQDTKETKKPLTQRVQ